MERLKADNGIKLREVFELEKSIQLTGRDMSHLSEAESRLKMELDQYTQKLKVGCLFARIPFSTKINHVYMRCVCFCTGAHFFSMELLIA